MTILNSVKEYLGIKDTSTTFDGELLSLINTAAITLSQLGVKIYTDLDISVSTDWPSFDPDDDTIVYHNIRGIYALSIAYIQVKTKTIFDPTASQSIKEGLTQYISELENRLLILISEGDTLYAESITTSIPLGS